MKAVPVIAIAAAGWLIISKLKRGKGKVASKPALAPEVTPPLPDIIEEDDEQDLANNEATPTHKRAASADLAPTSEEKEHKIKAMKVNGEPPATPMVLKSTNPEVQATAEEQVADEVESIPSPPVAPSTTAPPAGSATVTSEFLGAADSAKDSLFDEGESLADSEASSLSRTGSLQRLGSKFKGQLRKISSRSSKGSIQ
jgi:hypothetical protein